MTNNQPFGIYYKQNRAPKEPMPWFHEMGFDHVITEHAAIGEAAEMHGMGVVHAARFPWVEGASRTRVEAEVEAVQAEYQRLDSIIMNDEVMYQDWKDGSRSRTPCTYKKIAGWIRERGWQTPLCLAFLGPSTGWTVSQRRYFGEYLPAIDRLRMNVYPYLHSVPLGAVNRWVDTSMQHMKDEERPLPLTITLQTWRFHDELPPIKQLTVMSCLVLLSGAALSFYDFNAEEWDKTPNYTKGFYEMMTLGSATCGFGLRALRDEIRGKRVSHYLDRDGIFHAQASTEPNAKTWYYSINTTDKPYEDLAPFQIVRGDRPIRPYPPPDPYPWDENG